MVDKDRITTKQLLKDVVVCKNCPIRLHQKEDAILKYGKGCLFPDIVFVLPPQINNSVEEEFLRLICKDIINLDEQYITYNPKCFAYDDKLYNNTTYCNHILMREIIKLNPKKVIFFTDDDTKLIVDKIKVYKFMKLINIKYGNKTIEYFRDNLKQIL